MPIQKFIKIAGFSLLAFVILLVGLMLVLNGFSQPIDKTVYNQSGFGTFGSVAIPTDIAQSNMMFKGEIAADSALVPAREFTPNPATAAGVDKKIIKTGDLSLTVEKAETAAESITNIAKVNKGEVSDSNFSESTRGVKSGYIIIRVPFQNFTAAYEAIKKISTQVVSESTNAQDITEQYIDLEARLKNKQAEEVSFVALLSRAGKIEEVLSVTREVARVRGEIEQLQGQIRYLNTQTDMSTITVNLSEDVEIATASQDWRPWQVVKTSVKQLITGGQNLIDGLIRFIIIALPLLLLYGLIIWLFYYIGRRIYNRFKKSGQ